MGGTCSFLPSCASRGTSEEDVQIQATTSQPKQTAPQLTPSFELQDLTMETSPLLQVRTDDEVSQNVPRMSQYLQEYQNITSEIEDITKVISQCELAVIAARRKSEVLKANIELYGGKRKFFENVSPIVAHLQVSNGESTSTIMSKDVSDLDTKSDVGTQSVSTDTLETPIFNVNNFTLNFGKTQKICDSEIKKFLPANWNTRQHVAKLVTSRNRLSPECAEYEQVKAAFSASCKQPWRLQSINRIENPYTYLMYLLKKEEYQLLHPGISLECSSNFHGTETKNVAPICKNNFNWRLNKRNCKGVSFSVTASYAMQFSEKLNTGNKLIMADVLQAKTCEGMPGMILPPPGFDTCKSKSGEITVKYDDNTFYPKYLITFRGKGKQGGSVGSS